MYAVTESLGFLVSDVSRLMRRRFDERARTSGATGAQWRTLKILERHEGLNQGQIAELLEVEPITCCRMIDRLEEAGWSELLEETYVEPCGLASMGYSNHWTVLGRGGFTYPAEFGGDTSLLPGILERTADALDASGLVLWAADPDGIELVPIAAHGYPASVLSRMGSLKTDAENATSAAYRTGWTLSQRLPEPWVARAFDHGAERTWRLASN